MKAVYLTDHAGPEGLMPGGMAQPRPDAGQVLVGVHAAAFTPTEFSWFPTFEASRLRKQEMYYD